MAYEILTGKRPFYADTLATLAHMIVYSDRPSARAANPELPPAVDAVFRRGLARFPKNRYASCSEFVAVLFEALQQSQAQVSEAVKLPEPPPFEACNQGGGAPRSRIVGSVVAAVLLIALLSYVLWSPQPPMTAQMDQGTATSLTVPRSGLNPRRRGGAPARSRDKRGKSAEPLDSAGPVSVLDRRPGNDGPDSGAGSGPPGGQGVPTARNPTGPTAPRASALARGVRLSSLDPATVDDKAVSRNSGTPALIQFVNRSGRAVEIYWIDYKGNRVVQRFNEKPELAANASAYETTYLGHPFLVVASGTGATVSRDTGTRLAAFEAVTPNPSRDPSIHDIAIITGSVTATAGEVLGQGKPGASANATPSGPGSKSPDGVYNVGNGVSSPTLVFQKDPALSGAAVRLRAEGAVLLALVVQPNGTPAGIRVIRPFGYGLETKAIDAVRQWRFVPGMHEGKAVPVAARIEVEFHFVGPRDPSTWYSGRMEFNLVPGMTPPVVEDGSMPQPGQGGASSDSVVLEFTVDSKGSVRSVRSVQSADSASKLLSGFVSGWKFQPAMDGGRLVEATGHVWFSKR